MKSKATKHGVCQRVTPWSSCSVFGLASSSISKYHSTSRIAYKKRTFKLSAIPTHCALCRPIKQQLEIRPLK